jgi:hypothetical protein
MANIGLFKKRYSLEEAAKMLADNSGEPVTVNDLIDRINDDELPVWLDASGRFVRPVFPASAIHPDTTKYPFLRHGAEDYVFHSGKIVALTGFHRLYTGPRRDATLVRPMDAGVSETVQSGGHLIYGGDDESLLQIVRRRPEAPPVSRDVLDYLVDHEPIDQKSLWLAASDLRSILDQEGVTTKEGGGESRELAAQLAVAKARIAELESEALTRSMSSPASSRAAETCPVIEGVVFPYSTKTLRAMADIAKQEWSGYDSRRLPKSISVAREIDKALGNTPKGDKPTRAAEALAAAIRPDDVSEADGRNQKRGTRATDARSA